jgi:hypothetical protein
MLFRLALIALVLLTSLSLGMARGQMRAGTEIVLCGGTAVITDPDDPQGGARYCPDMATGLLLALDPPPILVALDGPSWRPVDREMAPALTPLAQPVPQARGPPLRQDA